MTWLTEHSIWVLLALIIFVAAWFVAFFARNHQAKRDQSARLDKDAKNTSPVPIKKSDKV